MKMNALEDAYLADGAYDHYSDKIGQQVSIGGRQYQVLDAVDRTTSGFQGVALRSAATGDIEISFRGTELTTDLGRDVVTDVGMVRHLVNNQLADADLFTRRVLEAAEAETIRAGHPVRVSATGHSLGGTHAEVMASRYKLPGEAFNSYGAVDLAYGVPEGQPTDAPPFINHARATDIVSAASRHYGMVKIYATEQDVEALRQGRYLDAPDPRHPANPMIAGQLGAHSISNFAPEPGKGESVLTAANEARYEEHQAAFDHFRHDVLTSRVALHDLLNNTHPMANKAHLAGQLDDAVDVARYKLAVRGLEYVTGLDDASERMQDIGNVTQTLGSVAQANVDATAANVQSAGELVDGVAHAASRALRDGGRAWHQAGDATARTAAQLRPAAPLAADAVGLGTRILGAVGEMAADDLANKASTAGSLFHGASDWASKELHQAGTALHQGAAWASRQWHDAGVRVQQAVDGLASTRAHDALRDTLRGTPRLDEPGHPDHPMYLQGWSQVQRLDAECGRASDQCSANLTGALVTACKAQGMTRIDAVTLSEDGRRAIATEQVLGRTFQRHAVVDTAQAVRTPLEQSSAQAAGIHHASPTPAIAPHAQAAHQAGPHALQR
ncbi:MAG TPA: XVIPCD domain-containing protein [Dyella sp.]|nr:XVIPCD domain-containing protein [Dyella sp.]